MPRAPQITVLMSVHNGERYLVPAIDSILEQSYTDFEFFITDDGSNDKTSSILNRYAERYSQIRVFRNQRSIGLPGSLNIMAGHATGKYLARMDADDIAHNNRFERQIEMMENGPDIDACFAEVNFMNEEGRIICERKTPPSLKTILDILPFINYFAHPTAFIRKYSFRKIGGYNELFFHGQDWELWQRMVAHGMHLEIVREILLDYRLNKVGNSRSLSRSSLKSDLFFEANLLVLNGQRVRALSLLSQLSVFEGFELFVRFLMPQSLYRFLIKLRAKYSKSSPQRTLLEQGHVDNFSKKTTK